MAYLKSNREPATGESIKLATAKDTASQIYEDLKSAILNLELEPGTLISEAGLCERYGVSRTPVRTAMHRLADKDLIELLPYQQTSVSLIDIDRVKEFVYARVAIEEAVIEDFIERGEPLLYEDVDHLIRKQQIVLGDDDFRPVDFYRLDSMMHELWFRAMGKMALWQMFQDSVDYTRMRMLDIKEEGDYRQIVADHVELLDVMRRGRKERVHEIISRHLYGGINRIEDRMTEKVSSYFKRV